MTAEHIKQGKDAETACCEYLRRHGLKLVDKNFSCRMGEIDIIMADKSMLVFVEVRFRKNTNFGGGLESITTAKQRKLRNTAELYLQQNSQYKNARFDVVSLTAELQTRPGKQQYIYDWVKNAF